MHDARARRASGGAARRSAATREEGGNRSGVAANGDTSATERAHLAGGLLLSETARGRILATTVSVQIR